MKVFGEDMRCPCVKGICVHDCREYVQLQPDLRWMVVEVALLSHKCLCSAVQSLRKKSLYYQFRVCVCVCVCALIVGVYICAYQLLHA